MTYLEIIEWIEQHITSIELQINELYRVVYIDDEGYEQSLTGLSLMAIVLEINKIDW